LLPEISASGDAVPLYLEGDPLIYLARECLDNGLHSLRKAITLNGVDEALVHPGTAAAK
jgi:hypothetical protein